VAAWEDVGLTAKLRNYAILLEQLLTGKKRRYILQFDKGDEILQLLLKKKIENN